MKTRKKLKNFKINPVIVSEVIFQLEILFANLKNVFGENEIFCLQFSLFITFVDGHIIFLCVFIKQKHSST